jgi:hypothetical protein
LRKKIDFGVTRVRVGVILLILSFRYLWQLQVLEAEGGIDYVAIGQQRAPVLPANAIFDEDTQDFVFYGEGAVSRGRKQI